MSQLGRISGPLLKANLVRDGVDLAFETDLLYLDVTNSRIGVNKVSPQADIDVNGTTRSNTFTIDNRLDVGNLHFVGNTITSDINTITFAPSGGEATVYNSRLQIDDIEITGNVISTFNSNANLELRPNGTGIVDIVGNTRVNGNLEVDGTVSVTGDINIGGNITIGDALTDEIIINASIKSDLVPETDAAYDLGSADYRWRNVWADNVYADTLNLPTLDIGNLMFRDNEITTTTGEDIYIDGNAAGGVRIGNLRIVDNSITNIQINAVTQIIHTGDGYFKIAGTNGFVPPVGNDAQRPTAYAVTGMTRYNTNSKSLEIWDGTTWASPAGSSGAVSETLANNIAALYAIILG